MNCLRQSPAPYSPIKNPLKLLCASLLLGGLAVMSAPAFADHTTQQLIDIMRANGSIDQAQYERLKAAAEKDDEAQHKQRDNQASAADWTSKIKLKGDIRLRYEFNDNDGRLNADGEQVNRHRGRVRYRLGIIASPYDRLEVGAGLASGGDDPRSTNQTFGNTFSSKGIQLDYAYAQYKFNEYFKAIAGKFKFKNYLWVPTDLIWDGDINPEGSSVNFDFDAALGNGAKANTFVNGGLWILNEFGNNQNDPYLVYGQLGEKLSGGNLFGSLAVTYYGYENEGQPGTFQFSAGTNTDNQFDVVNVSTEFGTKIMGGRGKIALVGDYVVNTATDTNQDTAFDVGAKMGFGKWSGKYLYTDLDANAVPDSFPDSDRFGGATDIKGHEVAIEYAVVDNVVLGLDYYNTQSKSSNVNEQLLQADFVVKF